MSSNRERAQAEALLRYPPHNPGGYQDTDLNLWSRACFAQGYKAALDDLAPEFIFEEERNGRQRVS